jgi:hypothetical protein
MNGAPECGTGSETRGGYLHSKKAMVANEDNQNQLRRAATEYFEVIEKSASMSRRQFL